MKTAGKSEEYYTTELIKVVLGFFILFLGVLGNLAVIFYNIFLNHDKTLSSWLVTNLAFADLLVCLAIHLTIILRFFFDELRGIIYCTTIHSTFYVSLFLSIMTLLVITIDKYLYIARPLKYPMIVTKRRFFIPIGCIWLATLVQFPIVYTSIQNNKKRPKNLPEKCHYPNYVVFLLILQLIPIGVIAILNYKMFKIVKEQRQRIALEVVLQQPHEQSQQKETWLNRLVIELKIVKTFAIVVGILMLCFAPHLIISVVIMFSNLDNGILRTAHLIDKQLVGINSIANAVIYALRHKKYAKAYRQLFFSAWAWLAQKNN